MKKIILSLAVAMITIVAKAEYLNWTVGSTFDGKTSGTDYDTANLYYTYDSGVSATAIGTTIKTPGSSSVDISALEKNNLSFFIEVYKYNDYEHSHVASTGMTYSDLVGTGAITSSAINAASIAMAFNGSAVVATPEPTSGLLLLMGFAMLGLKRKKEV